MIVIDGAERHPRLVGDTSRSTSEVHKDELCKGSAGSGRDEDGSM